MITMQNWLNPSSQENHLRTTSGNLGSSIFLQACCILYYIIYPRNPKKQVYATRNTRILDDLSGILRSICRVAICCYIPSFSQTWLSLDSAGPLLVHPLRQHVGVEGVPCPARVPIRPVGPGGGLHVAGPHGGLRTCRESR